MYWYSCCCCCSVCSCPSAAPAANLFLIGFLWIWLFLLHFWCVFSCIVTVRCFCRFSFCVRFFFPSFVVCVLRYFFSKDVRFGCWVLGVCVSFWSLLSMIESRSLWRFGNAFSILFSLGFGSDFRRSSFYALWGLPRNLYTLRITHFFWVNLGLENRINLSSRFWNSSKAGRTKN